MQKITIGIIGGHGNLGSYFARFFKKLGYSVLISDLDTKLSNLELAQKSDVVIVSVPIEKTLKVIKKVAPHVKKEGLLMDFTSIKAQPVKAMLKSPASVVGCHPMFGPTVSIKNQIVILSRARGNKWYNWIKNFFLDNDAIVKELNPTKHDEFMTVIQSLTHFTDITLAHALAKINIPIREFLKYQSPSYHLKLVMMGRILNQDAGLYGNIQIQNPKTKNILKMYLKSAKELQKIVKKKNLGEFIKYFNKSGDYLGDFKEQAHKESDVLIEFLNSSSVLTSTKKQKNISKISKNSNTITTLGPANSYSDLISKKYQPDAEIVYTKSIVEVFDLVKSGKVKTGVVPIENKIEGSIRETMDNLFSSNLKILHKLILPIKHCLVVLPDSKKSDIKMVLSHTQPLRQCAKYLKKHFPKAEILATNSSSEAMHRILNSNMLDTAAIGSVESAQNLGLKILAKNIDDKKENETHFYVIAKKNLLKNDATDKQTSIAFYFDEDTHGSLFAVLQEFARSKINLIRIESRPAGKKMGNYIFYLDFDGDIKSKKIKTMLKKIEKKVVKLKVLGCYDVVKKKET